MQKKICMYGLLSAFLCCLVLAAPVCRAHAKDAPAKTEQQRLEEAGELYFSYKPEEALEACEKADLNLDGWQNLRVSRLELGYVMLAQNLAGTEIDARPAWLIRIWGEIFGETESIAVAVDAQTGNILAM